MDQPRTKASVSRLRRTLLEIMQNLNYGQIADLRIERGGPIIDAATRIIKEIKIGATNGPRPELLQSDFVLRAEVIELFQHFDQLGSGRVTLIRVRAGLPCSIAIQREDFAQGGPQNSGDPNA